MTRAVLKNGVIVPIDPLPEEWADGRELRVEEVERIPSQTDIHPDGDDSSIQEDPEDDKRLMEAIARIRQQAKSMARRQLELPE